MKISLVVPVFNEEEVIPLFYDAVRKYEALAAWPVEIVFVDDGSTDATHALITQLSQSDPLVRSLSFIRNFGKEPALFAGLELFLPSGWTEVPMATSNAKPPAGFTNCITVSAIRR